MAYKNFVYIILVILLFTFIIGCSGKKPTESFGDINTTPKFDIEENYDLKVEIYYVNDYILGYTYYLFYPENTTLRINGIAFNNINRTYPFQANQTYTLELITDERSASARITIPGKINITNTPLISGFDFSGSYTLNWTSNNVSSYQYAFRIVDHTCDKIALDWKVCCSFNQLRSIKPSSRKTTFPAFNINSTSIEGDLTALKGVVNTDYAINNRVLFIATSVEIIDFYKEPDIINEIPPDMGYSWTVYNLKGRKIRTLYYGDGWNGIDDEGEEVPTGFYLYRVKTPTTVNTDLLFLYY